MKKLLLLAAMVCTGAQAQFKTGNQLLSDMQDSNGYKNGVAMGYVMGVTDGGSGVNFCPPANVTAGQVIDMVKNRLTSTPAIRHYAADIIVYAVLEMAWPCAKKGSGT